MKRIVQVTQKQIDLLAAQAEAITLSKQRPERLVTQSKFIDWKNIKSWKDPSYVPPQRAKAFEWVREILSDKPRTFQGIVTASLEMYVKELEKDKGSPHLEAARQAVANSRMGRKKRSQTEKRDVIPPGHPFVSNNFLKKEILGRLLAQDLLVKRAIRPVTGTVSLNQLSVKERAASGSPFHWYLKLPSNGIQRNPSYPLAKWSILTQWNRLIAGEYPGIVHRDWREMKDAQLAVQRTNAQMKGKAEMTDREMWSWEGRQPELTTKNQRLHLSVRKRKNRTRLELRRLKERLKYERKKAEEAGTTESESKTKILRQVSARQTSLASQRTKVLKARASKQKQKEAVDA